MKLSRRSTIVMWNISIVLAFLLAYEVFHPDAVCKPLCYSMAMGKSRKESETVARARRYRLSTTNIACRNTYRIAKTISRTSTAMFC
ncbi:hypothetical protein F5880DRAFT_773833 [Lentinula raphanica]|nr:hypothetical protein F5880DRAFT_773833 [Lentinula raphanica]